MTVNDLLLENEKLKKEIQNMKNGFEEKLFKLGNINAFFYLSQNYEYGKNQINIKLNEKVFFIRFRDAEELVYEISKILLDFSHCRFGVKDAFKNIIDIHDNRIFKEICQELDKINNNRNERIK